MTIRVDIKLKDQPPTKYLLLNKLWRNIMNKLKIYI